MLHILIIVTEKGRKNKSERRKSTTGGTWVSTDVEHAEGRRERAGMATCMAAFDAGAPNANAERNPECCGTSGHTSCITFGFCGDPSAFLEALYKNDPAFWQDR